MQINSIGIVSALAAFLSIWWGHVAVRKVEAVSTHLWLPMLAAIMLGIGAETVALRTDNINLSAACGIVGIIFLWDAFEFYRQQKRVIRGHAPANPNNPRHARILAEYVTSTTLDWLARNPRGMPYSAEELDAMKASVK